jgi:hypothetical protein
LGLIRIFTGLIVFYSHLVWTLGLNSFLGAEGMLPSGYREAVYGQTAWSHLDWLTAPAAVWAVHWVGLAIVAMLTLGIWTRATSVLTALLVISYANRATGALFGLDQILGFLCLYLAVGNCGGAFSIDQWRRRRRDAESEGQGRGVIRGAGDVSSNLAIRLIQIHMCIVYLFAGLGKLQGDTWWNGQAIWYSLASYEYQTMDLTWLAEAMWLANLLTLLTVIWEVSYAALVWPRLTRPLVLALAIPIHLGIGLCMGMMTFGLVMLVGNLAFVSSAWIRRLFDRSAVKAPA